MKKLIGSIFSGIGGFMLFLVAYILFLPLTLLNFCVVLWKTKKAKGYFISAALSLDIYANREFRALWNAVLRKKYGYPFGVPYETISSALGKNKLKDRLSIAGKALCFILDAIDKDHCIKSIKEVV